MLGGGCREMDCRSWHTCVVRYICVLLHENHESPEGRRILSVVVQRVREGHHEPPLPAGMLDEVAFAATRDPRCTTKNILELTITGKVEHLPIIPDALMAASIAMGCVLFLHARLREIFGGNDRERRGYIGGDMTNVREVDAQLNDLNKAFPVMAKAWESKLPAINMYAISVAPRGEDPAKEAANRLL